MTTRFVSGIDLLFNEQDSLESAIDEMVQANVIRTIGDLLCIAQDTGANIIELISEHFACNQEALAIADSILNSLGV